MRSLIRRGALLLFMALLALLPATIFATPNPAPTVVDGTAADVGRFSSLAVVNGTPAISYYDASTLDLKYVRATDASGTTWGTPLTLDSTGTVGWYTSLEVVNGNPAISYYDVVNQDLKYVRATDASGSTWGTPLTLDGTGTNVGQYTSLAVVNGNPAISYYDATNFDLKYMQATDISGTTWGAPLNADSIGNVGLYTSLTIVNGTPAISYEDVNNQNLKYVRATDASGTTWGTPLTLDGTGTNVGQYTSLAVVNGNPAISYYDATNFDLKYVRASDASGTTWGTPLSLDGAGTSVGQYTSLAIVNGNPAISYFENTNFDLKYVRASDASGTTWSTPLTYDSTGDVGIYTSLAVVNGTPAVSYFDIINGNLKYVRSGSPTPVTLTSFSAARAANSVTLAWSTASEVGVLSFQILRSPTGDRAAATPLPDGLVFATGDGVLGGSYTWTDPEAPAGSSYWLTVRNADGTTDEYGPVQPAATPNASTNEVYLPLVVR
jgi:hypothetical protein